MKKCSLPVTVCSRTFSKNEQLRSEMFLRFTNVRFNDAGINLSGPELTSFLKNSVGSIVALEKITDSVLNGLTDLKIISKYGVGLDNLDLNAIKKRGIQIGWTGGVNRRSVSELTLGMILCSLRKIDQHCQLVKLGEWKSLGGRQLSGKSVGIIGCGHIGKDLIQLLLGFNCTILIHDILNMTTFCEKIGAKQVSKDELLQKSDVVTLHIPYSENTLHFISDKEFSLMQPNAILINTSRGNVVNETALASALEKKIIAGAAMDVFASEPPSSSPLLKIPSFIATPHIGGSSEEGIYNMGISAITNLYDFLVEKDPS